MGSRSERWDRDRFTYERDRDRDRVRYDDDDLAYPRESAPQFTRVRERSEVGDRFERRFMDRRAYDDDVVLRTRDYYYDDEPPRRQRSPPVQVETDRRRVVIEKERIRSPSPPRRPGGMIRRQSSLDTFDRRPHRFYEREEYGPPARREDFRPPTNVPIPLPRSRALPPPRFVERDYYDDVRDIRVSEPDHFGDDDFRPMPERVREREREREVVRTRKRNHSRESRAMSHSTRSRSRSSSVSSRSSSSSGGTAIHSEYPKKGKTRIPARLVSERALVDMRYPFIKEGNTIIIQMALGQENIDDLLKISETYKKTEAEIAEERRRQEEIVIAPLPVVEVPPPPPPAPAPVIVPVEPAPPPPPAVEVVNTTTVIRDTSPSRSSVSSGRTPIIVDTRPREYSEGVPVGPLALVSAEHHKHRHRSHSRGNHSIRAEIRDLERELARRERHVGERELVKAERLSNGELVLYEETVERIEPAKKGIRIEKDKKGPPPKLVRAMLATLT